MARSRGFHPVRRSVRRKTTWEEGPPMLTTSTNLSANAAFIVGLGLQSVLSETTLVRTRGSLLFHLTSSAAVGDAFIGAVGIGLVSDQAFAIGATAVPMPVSEAKDERWIWHHWLNIVESGAGDAAPAQRIEIDSKAMRKFTDSDRLYMAVEVTETGTAVAEFVANTRMLFKLP